MIATRTTHIAFWEMRMEKLCTRITGHCLGKRGFYVSDYEVFKIVVTENAFGEKGEGNGARGKKSGRGE
jgi:hypothetical protein